MISFEKLFFLSICFLGTLHAELPSELYVKERLLSWTTTFDISSQEGKLGTVYRKFLSWTPQYHFEDENKQLVSKAIQRFWSLGSVFDIEDAEGTSLGKVEERLLNLLPTFDIYAPTGEKLAKAKLNFWGTTYAIKDPIDGHLIAKFHRPYLRVLNNWKVTIEDMDAISENKIHPHMFLALMAFQVDIEYWRQSKQNESGKTEVFLEELGPYRETLAQIEPREEDFQFIETITEDLDETNFYETATEIFEGLSSEQQSAFYLMLEARGF